MRQSRLGLSMSLMGLASLGAYTYYPEGAAIPRDNTDKPTSTNQPLTQHDFDCLAKAEAKRARKQAKKSS